MPEKVLIFDFDGVLADTVDDILRFGKIVSNKLGFPVTPTGDDLNDLNQMGFAEFGRQLGLPEDKLEKVQRAMRELEATTGNTFIIGDAVSDIRTAKEASVYNIVLQSVGGIRDQKSFWPRSQITSPKLSRICL